MKRSYTYFIALACGLFLISATIDLNNLYDYANQTVPSYITKDNTPVANPITNNGATLGRVLFYDKNLSVNNTISCASCHKQALAFGDDAAVSIGWDGGSTGRHSTRLVNTRFGEEEKFFWDERASSLEEQSTMPIQDHVEMGFSNTNGNPDIDSLITKLEDLTYYQDLFSDVYGDNIITEARIQDALAQFIRSIQSFDSKYDIGRAQVNNNIADFPNFTTEENLGKTLFMNNAQNGGANCNTCHNAPEFDIDDNSKNNSVISVAGDPAAIDVTNTRSPSLRDMVNPDGSLNGPLMHDGSFTTLMDVIDLYDNITVDPLNTNLDNRLSGPGNSGQNLNLTQTEKDALVAFLETLTGSEIYTAEQWSDPFDASGNITILNGVSALPVELIDFDVYGQDRKAILEWATLSETNNRGFEIQHSDDAINWDVLGFVEGKGNTNELNSYSFVHEQPSIGNNYYRLKQIDFNDDVDYSVVRVQNIEGELDKILAYPNPIEDWLYLSLPNGDFSISVINLQGKVIRTIDLKNSGQIDFSNFDSGVYLLLIKNNENQVEQFKKVIKG